MKITRPLLALAVVLALTLLAGCASRPSGPQFTPTATLAEKIDQTRAYLGVPGAAVIVKQRGKTLVARGFGSADVRAGRPVTPDTVFRVGSIAKPFIGVVVLQLAEEGRLRLDDPISRYVPGVPNGDAITLRMLGMHTSGLFNYIAAKEVKRDFATHPARVWKTNELLALSFAKKPHFTPPGEGFVYSNTNTILLGLAVEKVTGQPIEREVERRIIRPLGLKSTRFSDAAQPPRGGARGYNYGTAAAPIYWRGEGTVQHDVSVDSPSKWGAAGALLSSARDLATFTHALASGRLLSPKMRAEQQRWRACGYPLDYSYGFQLSKYQDALGHSGQVSGYQSCIAWLPGEQLEVTVCTNLYSSPNYEEPANWIFFIIAEHLTGRKWQYDL